MQQRDFNDEYLKPLSEKLVSENKEVILLGDFNIDFLKCYSSKNFLTFWALYIPLTFFLILLLLLD